MASPVFVKSYPPPEFDKREILRYARASEGVLEIDRLVDECIKEANDKLDYKVCYAEFLLSLSCDTIDLSFASVKSKDLKVNLKGCRKFVLFAATVGIGIDRLIAKYSVISPAKALIFQALGAERIESLCDEFCKDIKEKYKSVKPRFSPGYGDLPLEFQRDVFNVLDCAKKIGVTLNESLLMSPSKSVTAIIGIPDGESEENSGCVSCGKTDCEFRSERCLLKNI